jgi:lambda repressor-like predicted transcriptional regulator
LAIVADFEPGHLCFSLYSSINGTATMNIFNELGIPSRTISYCVVHQTSPAAELTDSQKGLGESLGKVKYHEELKTSLQNVLAEAAAIRGAFQSSLLEARSKSAQVAKGSLNQYLSTPIKSDNADVQRIIAEALEKYSDQILPTINIGIEDAWSSQILPDTKIVNSQTKLSVLVRRMLSGGKRNLKHLGFTRGKTPSNIFETVYLLETGFNLDVLEFIFRKSMAAGDMWQYAENTWTGIYNVLSTVGTAEQRGNSWEAALYPHTIGIQGAEFIAELEKMFDGLSKEFNLHQLSLWQNKFPFREDNTFAIRVMMIPDQKLLFEIIKWLGSTENENIKKALTVDAALIVKEIIS